MNQHQLSSQQCISSHVLVNRLILFSSRKSCMHAGKSMLAAPPKVFPYTCSAGSNSVSPQRTTGHDFTRQGSPRNQQTCTAFRADAPGSTLKQRQLTLFYPFAELCCGQESSFVSKARRSLWHSGNKFKPPQNSLAMSPRLHSSINSVHFHEILLIPTPPSNVSAGLIPVRVTERGSAGRENAMACSTAVGIMKYPGSAFEACISSREHFSLAMCLPAAAAGTDTAVQ